MNVKTAALGIDETRTDAQDIARVASPKGATVGAGRDAVERNPDHIEAPLLATETAMLPQWSQRERNAPAFLNGALRVPNGDDLRRLIPGPHSAILRGDHKRERPRNVQGCMVSSGSASITDRSEGLF